MPEHQYLLEFSNSLCVLPCTRPRLRDHSLQKLSLELLHFEYDSHNYKEVLEIKKIVEETITGVDWDFLSQVVLEKKHEWIDLDFFEQSKWP